ncbi:hypothetical protein D3C86_2190160 [compost metagenome]
MKALIITRSPSVSRPSTTPCVARHRMAISAVAMMICWPALSRLSVVWLRRRTRRSSSRFSS